MSSLIQMGHNSENLVGSLGLEKYGGIVLSPVNRDPQNILSDINKYRAINSQYNIVLDPQLYLPRYARGELGKQPYFPSDIETADFSSIKWWENVSLSLAKYAKSLQVSAVCSPVVLPGRWTDEFFETCLRSADIVMSEVGETCNTYCTLLLSLAELADTTLVKRIASIVANSNCLGYYLIFYTDVDPRRELTNSDQLAGAMYFINLLSGTGKTIVVSHCSSDCILFKAAGATACATGKFFNLRRFTKSRFDQPPAGGGGVMAYWFEQSLLSFIRQADLIRLQTGGLGSIVATGCSKNVWSDTILSQFESNAKAAWVALGWKQYLSWFAATEEKFSASDNPAALLSEWLLSAEANWKALDAANILFEERTNDGSWIRSWRVALGIYQRFTSSS